MSYISQDDQQLTVHRWIGSETRSLSSQDLLCAGSNLAEAASMQEGWSYARTTTEMNVFKTRGNPYKYYLDPPATVATASPVKEWGSAVEDHEIFATHNLEDFENTDLESLFNPADKSSQDARATPPSPYPADTLNLKRRRSKEEHPQSAYPAKRRQLDHRSLHHIIQQPHFCASPFTALSATDGRQARAISAYSKVTPTAILPHTAETAAEYLTGPYTRCAWVIPLRGAPPWDSCTSASIFSPSFEPKTSSTQLLPSGPFDNVPDPGGAKSQPEIVWTHDAIAAFWDFLRSLRDAGALGPISLSFHAASRSDDSYSLESIGAGRPLESPISITECASAPTLRNSLLSLDHFKLYHDARNAMQLRNVLDAWSFKPDNNARTRTTETQGQPQTVAKIRVLKGAILGLVDERSRGVLTC